MSTLNGLLKDAKFPIKIISKEPVRNVYSGYDINIYELFFCLESKCDQDGLFYYYGINESQLPIRVSSTDDRWEIYQVPVRETPAKGFSYLGDVLKNETLPASVKIKYQPHTRYVFDSYSNHFFRGYEFYKGIMTQDRIKFHGNHVERWVLG